MRRGILYAVIFKNILFKEKPELFRASGVSVAFLKAERSQALGTSVASEGSVRSFIISASLCVIVEVVFLTATID